MENISVPSAGFVWGPVGPAIIGYQNEEIRLGQWIPQFMAFMLI